MTKKVHPLIGVTDSVYSMKSIFSELGATVFHAADMPLGWLDGLVLPGGTDLDPGIYGEAKERGGAAGIDTERDILEITAARFCLEHDVPILGICRGHQALNIAAGGTLWQDIENAMSEYPDEFRGKPKPRTLTHHTRSGHTRVYTDGRWHDYDWHEDEDYGITAQELDDLDDDLAAWNSYGAYCGGWGLHQMGDHSITREQGGRFHLGKLLPATTEVNSIHHQAVKDLAPGFSVVARASDGVVEAIETTEHPFAVGVQFHPEMAGKGEFGHIAEALFKLFIEAAERKARHITSRRNFTTLRTYAPYAPPQHALVPVDHNDNWVKWRFKQLNQGNPHVSEKGRPLDLAGALYESTSYWLQHHDVPMKMSSPTHAMNYLDWVQRFVRGEDTGW